MNNFEIKESAESTARSMVNFAYYCSVLLIGVTIIAGVVVALSEDIWIGLLIVGVAILYLLTIVLFRALLDTFINISVKLDAGKEIVMNLQKIERLLIPVSDNTKQQVLNDIVEDDKMSASVKIQKSTPVDIDRKKIDLTCFETQGSELENEILGFVLTGDDYKARHLLMLRNGFTLNAAIEYIDNIKKQVNM